jgi:hypothetical protein
MTNITHVFFNPATGRVTDVQHPTSGFGGYSGLTAEQLDARESATHLLLTWDEAAVQVHAADRARYCKPAVEVSQERADEALNCLPPFRWTRQSIHASSWEAFALGEPLTDRLVWWFVRLGQHWFELVEDRMISYETLVGAVRGSEAFLQTGLAA